jgi:hypothetical protein
MNEHCPPHVHVENQEVPWEARLAFSFVSDMIRLMDVDPIGDAPSARAIDRIKAAIVNNLPRCRVEWWMKVGTCCLDNRWWVHMSRDGTVTALTRREAGAVQISRASYGPQAGQLRQRVKITAPIVVRSHMSVMVCSGHYDGEGRCNAPGRLVNCWSSPNLTESNYLARFLLDYEGASRR